MEAVPPQITPADTNAVAEVPASSDDIYRAQLQMAKAGKVQAAESLLGKAAHDPKVKKLINQKTKRGKGKGKGKKNSEVKSNDREEEGEGNGVDVPEGADKVEETVKEIQGKDTPKDPKEGDDGNEVLQGQWKEIDTW